MLPLAHGESGGSTTGLSGVRAAALAGGAVAEEGSSSVRSGASGGSASPVGESLGTTIGRGRAVGIEEGRACRTQTAAEPGRPWSALAGVLARLCSGTEPGGISVVALEAARVAQLLPDDVP